MNGNNDPKRIYAGGASVKRVMNANKQLWPAAYECTLAPESWTFGGQYLITTVPAAGGYASPTRWVFTIKDPVTHQTVHTIYISSLLTTPTIEEYINGQWVAAQNFRFTNGQWVADDRGTNGYGTSGSATPQSAPARQSRLTVTYTDTYNNRPVSATYTGTMVQNGNNAVSGTGYYSNITASLANYYDTGHQAPAYQSTTTLTATADFVTPYTFVDAVTGATNPVTYDKIQENAALTDDFTFSGPSWVGIGTPSSSGATITVYSRGTDYDVLYRYDRIRATLNGTADYDDVYVYQAMNIYIDQDTEYTGALTSIYPDEIAADATSFTVSGTLNYRYKYKYSSLAWDANWRTGSDSITPTVNSVSPSVGTSIQGNVVTIPANTASSTVEYETVSSITDPDGYTWSNLLATVTQESAAPVITFSTPVITSFYYPNASGYNIPASGGTVYPVIEFQQDYYINGVHSSGMTLHGYSDDGTNSGTMSDGDISSSFTINYYVGGQSSSHGTVSAGSRGSNPDPSGTTAIQIETNCYANVTAADLPSGNSSSVSVSQQANHETGTEEIGQTYSISGLSFAWDSGNAKALSAGEGGSFSWTSCKEYYYIRTWYTSGAHADGQTQYDRNITPSFSESSYWLDVVSGSRLSAEKQSKYGSERSATVSAVYDGNILDSVTVTQAETTSWYSLESSYDSGLSFTAAGGSQTVTFTGYHRYDNGDSPDTTNSPSVSVTYDGDISGRISNGGNQGRTITANNLGTTPYNEVSTYYTYQWTLHSEATCSIPVTQGPNEPGNFGTVNFPDPSGTIAASGGSKTLSPTCSFTWTSGSSGTMGADGFDFEWVTKGNDGDRTYSLSGNSATFGTLGTNTTSRVNTWLRATLRADSSKSDTAAIQEEPNGPTNNHELTISWSNPVTIPGYGGSVNVGIVTAKYKTQYDSGAWDNGENIAPSTIAASIQISGTGFTKSYTGGNSYVTISAPYNPSPSSSRDCDVTAYYGGESGTTSVTQKNCPFDVDYVETTEGGQRIRTAYIYNTDDERHRYEYTKETSVAGEITTTSGTTGTINAGNSQNMGAVPLVSGYTNTISVVVSAVQYYSGGRWVSHAVIT